MTAGGRKVLTSTFFNAVHLLSKEFEHGGGKLASYPGRHLTSLRPCSRRPSVIEDRILGLVCFMHENNYRVGISCQTDKSASLRFSTGWESFLREPTCHEGQSAMLC